MPPDVLVIFPVLAAAFVGLAIVLLIIAPYLTLDPPAPVVPRWVTWAEAYALELRDSRATAAAVAAEMLAIRVHVSLFVGAR